MPGSRAGSSRFPDPRRAPANAPLAWGNDLRTETLLEAYGRGIFPWPDEEGLVHWWSPDPRAIVPLDGLRVSRSLRRTLRDPGWHITVDTAFGKVIRACAQRRGEATWITPELMQAYHRLHAAGAAHSVEVWREGALAGGLYGITVGGVFTGESMFHRRSDASKVALVRLVERLSDRGFTLLDAQLPTAHLLSMGASAVPRRHFLDQLDAAVRLPVTFR